MEAELRNRVMQLLHLLQDWKGENTLALGLAESVSWARVCLISTCNSQAHMRGILNELHKTFAVPKHLTETSWYPIDMGDIVVHLMSREAREFYELEELWPVEELIASSE